MLEFNEYGLLDAGDYELTILQLKESLLVKGHGEIPWDAEWRIALVNNLEIMVNQLWQVGITEIFIDGSFVEDKAHPNDIDGYFECDFKEFISGNLTQELNLIEPDKIWTWEHKSRKPYRTYEKKQLPMWHKYRVELYPHWGNGPQTGIKDEFGYDQLFPAAFRKTRDTFKPKGIIKIIKK